MANRELLKFQKELTDGIQHDIFKSQVPAGKNASLNWKIGIQAYFGAPPVQSRCIICSFLHVGVLKNAKFAIY